MNCFLENCYLQDGFNLLTANALSLGKSDCFYSSKKKGFWVKECMTYDPRFDPHVKRWFIFFVELSSRQTNQSPQLMVVNQLTNTFPHHSNF